MLKLAEAHLRDKVFHSTHISGFSQGALKDPGPKGFLAIGLVNVALAEGKLPEALKELWEGKRAMVDRTGKPLGPTDLFAVFTGLLDLGLEDVREIPAAKEREVVKTLGRWFRRELAVKGVDYVVEDAQRLRQLSPTIEALLLGRVPNGDEVVAVIPLIAKELGVGEGEVWDVVEATIKEDPSP